MSQLAPFVGEIRLFAFPRAPTGWFACDGRLLSIDAYQVLFALLGTTYGGNGQTTFALPDLRGRLPVDQGSGLGLSTRVIGQILGSEEVTLSSNNLPAHTHDYHASTTNASANVPTGGELAALTTDTMYTTVPGPYTEQMSPQAVTNTGGNGGFGALPHDNSMPTLTVSYCIAYEGIYPSQS
jgi:microcystin-dependent protein